jgi:tetratricopeptide (TPR) repeat protein
MLRHLLSATILVMFLVVGAATWWINSARLRARANASLAMAHSAEATLQRHSAVTAQASAERRERETRDALSLAKRRETEARVALDLAERRVIAQRDVSSEQYQLGRACSALGRPADALEHFVRMLELEKTQSAHDPESKIGRINLALAYFHIGQANLSLNRMASAIDAKRQVVNIYQSIADDEPSVVHRRLLLGLFLNWAICT